MTISQLMALGVAKLTNQQLADLALMSDWDRRRAIQRGDFTAARQHTIERDKLLKALD